MKKGLINVDLSKSPEKGKQHYMDVQISYRCVCLNAIAYLKEFGFAEEQAYLLLSAASVEWCIHGIVDIQMLAVRLHFLHKFLNLISSQKISMNGESKCFLYFSILE